MQNRELQERQEMALFENDLALEFLERGKPDKLKNYLKMNNRRLRNGMTAEEIDAVKTRAREAYEEWDV